MKKLKVVFMGTPDFSLPSLDTLFYHPLIELKLVISKLDTKKGRGQKSSSPAVIEFAKEKKIPFFQTENINKDEECLNLLEKIQPDLIIVLAFSQFLSNKVLNLPAMGAFNIHTSILPKYRGAAPIQYALLNDDKSTGVSIQKMVKKMDAGDICLFQEIDIFPYENAGMLYAKLKYKAALCLNEFIDLAYKGELNFTPQSESDVSFAPIIKKDDGKINFSQIDLKTFKNKLRAYQPWPGVFCKLNDKNLKIFSYEVSTQTLKPGETSSDFGILLVGLKDSTLRLSEVQLQGKRKMSDKDLLNGMRDVEIKLS